MKHNKNKTLSLSELKTESDADSKTCCDYTPDEYFATECSRRSVTVLHIQTYLTLICSSETVGNVSCDPS